MSPLVSDHYTYANIVLLLGDRSSITSDESAKEVQTAVEGAFGGVRCLIECSVDVLYLTISVCVVLCVRRKERRFIRPTTQWQPRPELLQLCLSIRYARLSPFSVFVSHVCCCRCVGGVGSQDCGGGASFDWSRRRCARSRQCAQSRWTCCCACFVSQTIIRRIELSYYRKKKLFLFSLFYLFVLFLVFTWSYGKRCSIFTCFGWWNSESFFWKKKKKKRKK